jgi:hypothetical protein
MLARGGKTPNNRPVSGKPPAVAPRPSGAECNSARIGCNRPEFAVFS